MEQEIVNLNKGISRSPSYGEAGEMSELVNLIPKHGELVAIEPPKDLDIEMEDGEQLMYVYNENYISCKQTDSGTDIYYFTKEDETRIRIVSLEESVIQVQGIGNTLIALTEGGLEYILYKDNSYKHLGKKPPLLEPNWNLIGKLDEKEREIDINELSSVEVPSPGILKLEEELSNKLTQEAAALANTYITENAEQGRFTSSFLVCAAYKMLGGQYMMSPPVLMRLNEGMFPTIGVNYVGSAPSGEQKRKLTLHAYSALLYCTNLPLLTDWKDIITSIDVFVSSPIRRYNQDGKIEYISSIENNSLSYSVLDDANTTETGVAIIAKHTLSEKGYFLDGMQKDDEDYYEQFKASQFYKIKSISVREMSSSIYSFGESLVGLETLEGLDTSGYQEHDIYVAKKAFIYNSRVNLYGVQEIKRAFPILSLVQYTNGYISEGTEVSKTYQWNVRYVIASGGQQVDVTNVGNNTMYEEPTYLFYPDNNVEEVILERIEGDTIHQVTLPMESHPYLQGSYWFNNFKPITWLPATERLATTEGIIKESNKLYTSEVNNPFIFPLGGINTIGTGEIVGVSTTTKALSQGQFGQFPLYVFATDGIWAMEVGSTGLYSSIHAVSRDVCNNADSITQIDMAVVFSTEQGLKLLQGSDVVLLSGKMDGMNLDESAYDVVDGFGELFVTDTDLFVEMLRSSRIVYDYPHGLLHIYPSGGRKHYVYSLEENAYSTFVGEELVADVAANPNTIVQLGNRLYDYSYNRGAGNQRGVAITRPVSLGDPFAMKILADLRSVKRIGESGKVRIAVWGNNTMDDNGWVRVPSLRQHSFKYYRFALYVEMGVKDGISGIGVRYDYRRTNKMR